MERLRRSSLWSATWRFASLSIGIACAATSAAGEQAWDEARVHYERGRDLEDEGNLTGALSELQRAMELRPTFRLHRHMGRVCRGLARYREAYEHYQTFLDGMFEKKNAGRGQRFEEEREALGALPAKPLPFFGTVETKVRNSSTISVRQNTYSVPSRLIGV